MLFSVRFEVCVMFLTLLLILPERGRPLCHRLTPRGPGPVPPCCTRVSKAHVEEPIVSCFEQRETRFAHCKKHAFIFTTVNQTHLCVDPKAKWLPRVFKKLQKRDICCYVL